MLALFTGACLLSCGKTPLSEVFVYYAADEAISQVAGCLRVDVFSIENPADPGVPLAPVIENLTAGDLPVRLALSPASNDARTGYRLAAELFEEPCDVPAEFASSLGVQEVVSTFVQNEKREIWVVFDADCAGRACPAEFRCQEGLCVEYCVEPEELSAFAGQDPPRSGPVACGDPCTDTTCEDDRIESCTENGAIAIAQECGFGCNEVAIACNQIAPSNLGDGFQWVEGFSDLVVEGEESETLFDTDDGSVIEVDRETGAVVSEIREAGSGVISDIGFERITADLEGPDATYGVFTLDTLTVAEGATLRGVAAAEEDGSAALVILANLEVTVFGTISVSATDERPGPGGFPGGGTGFDCGTDGKGCGRLGGGRPGEEVATCCLIFDVFSGAGGGSYGALGGAGGDAFNALDVAVGGEAGQVRGTEALFPLLVGGSGGGRALPTTGPTGGHGGGALQISTNDLIRVGPRGTIDAGGGGGGMALPTAAGTGGGGGGSGGAILLEAWQVVFDGSPGALSRIGAPGGGGGGGLGPGEVGDPRRVPAPGGGGEPRGQGATTAGGEGSIDEGRALSGVSDPDYTKAGGGGGGGGRIRINTRAGESDREALLPFVTPRSEETFTVGQAATMEPE